jgi:DNA repair protein RecO
MIANDLLRTQLPHKATPKLYELLLAYFKHLPLNPSALAQSFRLKLLQHEGLILLSARCTHCNEPASHLSEGESVCLRHSSTYRHSFEEHEWKLLLALSSIKRFSELKTTKISSAFEQKTENLLKERIR